MTISPHYGCHNRPPLGLKVLPVQAGWYLDGVTRTPQLAAVPHSMSTACNYTTTELGRADPRCEGCKWKS